jgi:hypothetical protein
MPLNKNLALIGEHVACGNLGEIGQPITVPRHLS